MSNGHESKAKQTREEEREFYRRKQNRGPNTRRYECMNVRLFRYYSCYRGRQNSSNFRQLRVGCVGAAVKVVS
jgi:hypothetical protein